MSSAKASTSVSNLVPATKILVALSKNYLKSISRITNRHFVHPICCEGSLLLFASKKHIDLPNSDLVHGKKLLCSSHHYLSCLSDQDTISKFTSVLITEMLKILTELWNFAKMSREQEINSMTSSTILPYTAHTLTHSLRITTLTHSLMITHSLTHSLTHPLTWLTHILSHDLMFHCTSNMAHISQSYCKNFTHSHHPHSHILGSLH